MQILFVTCDLSWPLSSGGTIRQWNILQGLLRAGDTDALIYRPAGQPIAAPTFAGCRRIIETDKRHFHFDELPPHGSFFKLYQSTLGRGVLTLRSRLPFEWQGEALPELHRQLREQHLDFRSYDVVWFNTARAAMPFRNIGARATVLDGDDYSHRRELSLLRAAPWYGAKIWNYIDIDKLWWWERGLPRYFSRVARCSPEDRDRFPAPNVVVIPNGTNVPARIARHPQPRVLFVGDLGYAANSLGAEWFLREVWPKVRQAVPRASFDIAGKNPSAAIQAAHGNSGVQVHGFVRDLGALYANTAVAVVPLHAGGGTRLKILESLAYEVPVVSTTIGAFGIDAGPEHGLLREDSADAFAARCAQLLTDPAAVSSTATAGRDLVSRKYDWQVIQQQVAQLVRKVASETEATAARMSESKLHT